MPTKGGCTIIQTTIEKSIDIYQEGETLGSKDNGNTLVNGL